MATYRVGDRVRVVRNTWACVSDHLIGMEGRVVNVGVLAPGGYAPYGVLLDSRSVPLGFQADELEPIQQAPTCQQITEMTGLPEGPVRQKEAA